MRLICTSDILGYLKASQITQFSWNFTLMNKIQEYVPQTLQKYWHITTIRLCTHPVLTEQMKIYKVISLSKDIYIYDSSNKKDDEYNTPEVYSVTIEVFHCMYKIKPYKGILSHNYCLMYTIASNWGTQIYKQSFTLCTHKIVFVKCMNICFIKNK